MRVHVHVQLELIKTTAIRHLPNCARSLDDNDRKFGLCLESDHKLAERKSSSEKNKFEQFENCAHVNKIAEELQWRKEINEKIGLLKKRHRGALLIRLHLTSLYFGIFNCSRYDHQLNANPCFSSSFFSLSLCITMSTNKSLIKLGKQQSSEEKEKETK